MVCNLMPWRDVPMSHAKQLHNRRYLNDYLEIINREGLPGNIKHDLCLKVQETVIATVQHVIEAALDEELSAYLGWDRYEHVPWGRPPEATRSGSYQRALLTQYGPIAALHVPKVRRGNGALTWHSITRYERCWGPLLDQQVLSYCLGHSLRDLQETMALTLGEVLSLAACTRIVSSVAAHLEGFKTQPLESPPPIILVDGMWVKIAYPTGEYRPDAQGRRRSVKHKQKRVVLSALGVWPDGHWEIVHGKVAEGERAATWKGFLGELYLKGITEATTDLGVSDGANGLESALDPHFYGVPHQRCIFHKIKQLADHLVFGELAGQAVEGEAQATREAKRRRKKAILVDASQVYKGASEAAIREQADVFRETWQGREPQAVATFFLDFDKTLAYLAIDFPPPLALLIRTTNLLERFHKEMRRKQHDIGMFQSEQGWEVLWYLVSMRETAKQRAAVQT
jgi:putative transposase